MLPNHNSVARPASSAGAAAAAPPRLAGMAALLGRCERDGIRRHTGYAPLKSKGAAPTSLSWERSAFADQDSMAAHEYAGEDQNRGHQA
jgi:hypothetical protein